jgi:hypothetical protein
MPAIFWAMALLAAAAGARAEQPGSGPAAPLERAGPENVLVVYVGPAGGPAAASAEYYARRRGVPSENLLAVELPGGEAGIDYPTFYRQVLTPVREKLRSRAADGRPLAERILYILLAPGLPTTVNTRHDKAGEHPLLSGEAYASDRRALDQWLISVEENFAAGFDPATGKPGRARSTRLADVRVDGKPLHAIRHEKEPITRLDAGGLKLGAIIARNEGRLGDIVVGGRKLEDVPVGAGRLGDLEVGSKEKPLRLGDVPIRFLPLGSSFPEVTLPIAGLFDDGERTSFRRLRARNPELAGIYLVTRLGKDPDSARRAVDGALYAERYLRGGGGGPEPAIWLDQKFAFAGDQVAAQARCTELVQAGGGLFEPGRPGPLAPWKLVIDNQNAEVGFRPKEPADAPPHKPTAGAKVKAVEGGFLVLETTKIGQRESHMAGYFPPGGELAAKTGAARAAIRAVDVKGNRLELSSADGFKAGEEVVSVWPGAYPAADCFFFFGFYGLGRYEDVFAFPPGAIGIHVDSSCMNWARGALDRGVAATFGVVNEPCSAGIPYGHAVLAALVRGNDLAEAMSGGLLCAQRWAGIIFGDPLYAPFREAKAADRTPPVLAEVAARPEAGGVRVTARLGGTSPDELAEVALFRIEWGPDARYGSRLDFIAWPEPESPRPGVKGRDYSGYARFCSRLITGLEKGRTWHFRVTARDPAGNETVGADGTFTY